MSHWQENRCACPGGSAVVPATALGTPSGYLIDGATFGGEMTMGPPGKTAVDQLIRLTHELEEIEAERDRLLQELQAANATVVEHATAIDTARKELQLAIEDYQSLQDRLVNWDEQLRGLDQQYREHQQTNDDMLDQFESELQGILTRFEGATESPDHTNLDTPRESAVSEILDSLRR